MLRVGCTFLSVKQLRGAAYPRVSVSNFETCCLAHERNFESIVIHLWISKSVMSRTAGKYIWRQRTVTASHINVSKIFIWFVGEENIIIINTTFRVRSYYSLFWTKSQLQWRSPNLLCGFQFLSLTPLRRATFMFHQAL